MLLCERLFIPQPRLPISPSLELSIFFPMPPLTMTLNSGTVILYRIDLWLDLCCQADSVTGGIQHLASLHWRGQYDWAMECKQHKVFQHLSPCMQAPSLSCCVTKFEDRNSCHGLKVIILSMGPPHRKLLQRRLKPMKSITVWKHTFITSLNWTCCCWVLNIAKGLMSTFNGCVAGKSIPGMPLKVI